MSTPSLSVVLATYNRADTLRRTLEHLAAQDLDPGRFEVIVVDDGSPDATREVTEAFARTAPYALTYLHHENRGPGYTQNRGLRAAKAPIALLMADDIWLGRTALRAHLEAHARSAAQEIAVLGKVLQSPECNQTAFLRRWDPFGLQDLRGVQKLPFFMFWVCNISVKTRFLLDHGMFREKSGPGGHHTHHDTELGYRLRRHGLRILFSEEALGYHYHPATLDQTIGQYYQRGLNWEAFRELVPAPEALILVHLLTLATFKEYVQALRTPDPLPPGERSLLRHVARTILRTLAFNRLTVPGFWSPFLARVESSPLLETMLSRRMLRALLHYHFVRGIHDGGRRIAEGSSR
jgi:glycosyltransferase involved in cell wall biosynthesis